MTKNLLIGLFAVFIFASCGKISRKATINRDCTGTYLELNNKDYIICNPSMVSSIADGSSVRVKYKSFSSCSSGPAPMVVCELYHKNYGSVEIIEVK